MENIVPNEIANEGDRGGIARKAIALQELQSKARSRADLYNVVVQAQHYAPAMKSSICTTTFLSEVLTGQCALFPIQQIRQKTLFQSLSKRELKAALITALEHEAALREQDTREPMLRLVHHLHQKDGDPTWSTNMLATLDYEDRLAFFKPPMQQMQQPVLQPHVPAFNQGNMAQRRMVDLPEHVVETLRRMPASSAKGTGINLNQLLTPVERAEEKLRKLEAQEAKARARRLEQEAALRAAREPAQPQMTVKMDEAQHQQFQAFLAQQ